LRSPDSGVTTAIRLAVVLGLVATLVACSGDRGSNDGGGGSVADFCSELESGRTRLAENVDGETTDLPGQLAGAIANIGEFTRLLHRLEEVAPSEIETEMSDAAELWDDHAGIVADGVNDPVGALAASIVASTFASGSVREVDEFAANNCETQLFGTYVPTQAGGDPTTSWECLTADDATRPDLSAAETAPAQLVDQLSLMSRSAEQSVSRAAIKVLDEVSQLRPAAESAREALGRVRFRAGTDSEVDALVAAIGSACPGARFAGRLQEAIDEIGPGYDGPVLARTHDLYGSCADSKDLLGWPTAEVMAWSCGSDALIVNTQSGMITRHADVLPKGFSADQAVVFGGKVSWLNRVYTEATGLKGGTWDASVRLLDALTGKASDVSLVKDAPDSDYGFPVPDPIGTSHGLVAMVPDQALSRDLVDGGGEFIGIGFDGKVTWRKTLKGEGSPEFAVLTSRSVQLGLNTFRGRFPVVDIATGAAIGTTSERDFSGSDQCGTNAGTWAGAGQGMQWFHDSGASTKVTRAKLDVNLSHSNLTASGSVAYFSPEANSNARFLRATDLAGKELWRIGPDIATDVAAIGAWVIVENTAGESVAVDARTGEERTPSDPALIQVFETWQFSFSKVLALFPADGFVWMSAPNGHVRVPFDELCS